MDQTTFPRFSDRTAATKSLTDYVAASVDRAAVDAKPFYHLELSDIFPEHMYRAMVDALPLAEDYRSMHGRTRVTNMVDGTHTRVKIDLFPEYIRHLPAEKLAVWRVVGDALRSEPVKDAFRRKLAPALEQRFGADFAKVGLYPIPILTRDIPGYSIHPHTDTRWKGITVQLYLPRDNNNPDIGTIFHEKLPDGSLPKTRQMSFSPNSGYAFAVGADTWHSADPVHNGVKTRDSILLTYFVDDSFGKVAKNRLKRFGNFILNEVRNRT